MEMRFCPQTALPHPQNLIATLGLMTPSFQEFGGLRLGVDLFFRI